MKPKKPRKPPYPLEPLDPDEVNKAYREWLDEDDGTDDYPTLGEVLSMRFGRPKTSPNTKLEKSVSKKA